MHSPQSIIQYSTPFKRKSLLCCPFWGRQRCFGRKSWLLKSLIFQPTCPVCPKDHTSQSLPRPFKRIVSHAKEHVVVFDAFLAQFVKQATLVYEILFVVGKSSKRTNYITLVVDPFRSIMLRSSNSRRFLQRSMQMDTTQDSLWNRKAMFALRGGPVNEERCKKWITGRGELGARAAHARLGLQQQHDQQHAGRDSPSLSSASSLMSSLSPFSRLWCHSRPSTMILHCIGEVPSSKSIHGSVNLFGFQYNYSGFSQMEKIYFCTSS